MFSGSFKEREMGIKELIKSTDKISKKIKDLNIQLNHKSELNKEVIS